MVHRNLPKRISMEFIDSARLAKDVTQVRGALAKAGKQARLTETMSLSFFRLWYDAIKHDRVDLVEEVLHCACDEDVDLLLHGMFDYEYDAKLEGPECERSTLLSFRRAYVLAAAFGSLGVFKVFLEYCCKVDILDVAGNNIVHCIVLASASRPDGCRHHVRVYERLMSSMETDDRRDLLMRTNDEGLRPLELAAKVGSSNLLLCILEEPDVYCFTRHTEGLYTIVDYDVTDYEGHHHGNRFLHSPLLHLVDLTINRVSRQDTRVMFNSVLMKHWMRYSFLVNSPLLVFWFLQRLLFCMGIFVANSTFGMFMNNTRPKNIYLDGRNVTNKPCFPDAVGLGLSTQILMPVGYTLTVYACCVIIFDVCELFYNIKKRKRSYSELMGTGHDYVVHTALYRSINFFVCFTAVFRMFYFLVVGQDDVNNFFSVVYIVMNIVNIWILFYFLELAPVIGTFVIAIERMLLIMANFSIILLILYAGFAQTFYQILAAKGYCMESFKDIGRTIYSTFRVLLNMFDFFTYERLMDDVAIQVLHVVFVLIIPIMLFNYLIALMSQVVSGVHEHQEMCITLQRLHASLTTERRMTVLCGALYRRLKARYYVIEGDRMYLRCRTIDKQVRYQHHSSYNNNTGVSNGHPPGTTETNITDFH